MCRKRSAGKRPNSSVVDLAGGGRAATDIGSSAAYAEDLGGVRADPAVDADVATHVAGQVDLDAESAGGGEEAGRSAVRSPAERGEVGRQQLATSASIARAEIENLARPARSAGTGSRRSRRSRTSASSRVESAMSSTGDAFIAHSFQRRSAAKRGSELGEAAPASARCFRPEFPGSPQSSHSQVGRRGRSPKSDVGTSETARARETTARCRSDSRARASGPVPGRSLGVRIGMIAARRARPVTCHASRRTVTSSQASTACGSVRSRRRGHEAQPGVLHGFFRVSRRAHWCGPSATGSASADRRGRQPGPVAGPVIDERLEASRRRASATTTCARLQPFPPLRPRPGRGEDAQATAGQRNCPLRDPANPTL